MICCASFVEELKMESLYSIYDLPNKPAVYVLHGGKNKVQHFAYVGISDTLRNRIIQHLVGRDSSIATGTSAVGLNPDYVTEVTWWESEVFTRPNALEAAELIAFKVLDPVLRSRGAAKGDAKKLSEDEVFTSKIQKLFSSEPTGRLILPSLRTLVLDVRELAKRVSDLEARGRGENVVKMW
jgi:hypothetical protein